MPRGVRREVSAPDHIPALPPLELGDTPEIVVADRIRMDEADLDAFMQEMVEVVVAESTDENAVPLVEVSVNGRRIYLQRGVPTMVKRMYVERLARAKKMVYSQNLDPRLGESINTLHRRSALDYPFAVTNDTEKGKVWLKKVLSES